ncbi:hypothetical protein HYU19_06175 [Candidatus Woesearchaeota archaeon]|nr:hypothetical protein [Candidatus Woesearchaeota archaeon]
MGNPVKQSALAIILVLLASLLLTGCMGRAIEKASVAFGPGQPVLSPSALPQQAQEQAGAIKEGIEEAPAPKPEQDADSKASDGEASNVEERIKAAYGMLHQPGSGAQIRRDFPNIQLVYTDEAKDDPRIPPFIIPFRYYYSAEADTTFNICNIDITVFICKGKLDRLINADDVKSGACKVSDLYLPMIPGLAEAGMVPEGMPNGIGGMPGQMPPGAGYPMMPSGYPMMPPPGMMPGQMPTGMAGSGGMPYGGMQGGMPGGYPMMPPPGMMPGQMPTPEMMKQYQQQEGHTG